MDFSFLGGASLENAGANTSASAGTSLPHTASNSKGAWTQLISSTAYPVNFATLFLNANTIGVASNLVDIAIGASSSEVIIAGDLLYNTDDWCDAVGIYHLPLLIPAGSRIAARKQTSSGDSGYSLFASMILGGRGFGPSSPLSRVTTYGAATGDSGGVQVDPGGTANTKGGYSQIVSSTTNPIKYLFVGISTQGSSKSNASNWLLDIAVGASSSEQVIVPNIPLNTDSNSRVITPSFSQPIPVNIPAGTRLSARAQCSSNNASQRVFDVVLYGVD